MLTQRLVRPYEHVKHEPNFKPVASPEGPVAEFSGFANFEEKKMKSNLLMSYPKKEKNVFSLLSADSRYFRIYALKCFYSNIRIQTHPRRSSGY